MVAGCPKCGARYRVDADRIGPDGAKLRCTKCSAVFLVRAPRVAAEAEPVVAAAPTPAPVEAAASAPTPTPVEATAPPSPVESSAADEAPAPSEPMAPVDRERLVLIADPDDARGKASADAVESWGLQPHLVQDGVEAMLAIQRMLPRAVVLDAALPKMFGFQVCEVVKRNESLRGTVVVLVGAIHHQDRYRRAPADLYGADVYIEQPDLPDGLQAILREGGLPMGGGAAAPSPPPSIEETPAPEPVAQAPEAPEPSFETTAPAALELELEPSAPEPAVEAGTPAAPEPGFETPVEELELDFVSEPPAAPEPIVEEAPTAPEPILDEAPAAPVETEAPAPAADEDPETTEERERALRLARIAVSEMLLYQPEKFEQASRDGNLEQALDLEIQEARALLRQRIREDVREETDFIMDELNRVAAERNGQG